MLSVYFGRGKRGNGSRSCCQLTAAGRKKTEDRRQKTEDRRLKTEDVFVVRPGRRCLLRFNEVFTSVWHLTPSQTPPNLTPACSVKETTEKCLQWSGKYISFCHKIAINFPMPRAEFSCLCSENLSPTAGKIPWSRRGEAWEGVGRRKVGLFEARQIVALRCVSLLLLLLLLWVWWVRVEQLFE